MEHYKSWSGLSKQLEDMLCDDLKGRVTYFLTRYHKAHDSYGRAAIRVDGKELVCFSWIEMYNKECDISKLYEEDRTCSYEEMKIKMKPKWDSNCTYYDMDFLDAALEFRNLSIQDALNSENYIIKILAIMDRRTGKRTLLQIANTEDYKKYPGWVRQFYELRIMGQRQ